MTKIYLDTSTLQKWATNQLPNNGESILNRCRESGDFVFVISLCHVIEIIQREDTEKINALSNFCENLSVKWIDNPDNIFHKELQSAIYKNTMNPFVDDFVDSLLANVNSLQLKLNARNLSFSQVLSDKILRDEFKKLNADTILNKDTIDQWSNEVANKLKQMNSQQKNSKIKSHFKEKLIEKIAELNPSIETIEQWIKDQDCNTFISPIHRKAEELINKPEDIPSFSLTYYIQHEIHKNPNQSWQQAHIFDLHHLAALPYVDFITVDRQMGNYLKNACKFLHVSWNNKAISDKDLNRIE